MKLGKIDAQSGEPIGKVIKIPNEYTIIVNVGNDVLSLGDDIYIVEAGSDVIDPDTGEKLGRYDFIKEELSVEQVYPQFSVCKKIKYENKPSVLESISPLISGQKTKVFEKIQVNEEHNDCLELKNPEVNIGDSVKLKLE